MRYLLRRKSPHPIAIFDQLMLISFMCVQSCEYMCVCVAAKISIATLTYKLQPFRAAPNTHTQQTTSSAFNYSLHSLQVQRQNETTLYRFVVVVSTLLICSVFFFFAKFSFLMWCITPINHPHYLNTHIFSSFLFAQLHETSVRPHTNG